MVILTGVRITTIERREKEKRGILDTGSRWTWISKGVADEMGIELTKKMKARTADNRLAEGVLSAKPVKANGTKIVRKKDIALFKYNE